MQSSESGEENTLPADSPTFAGYSESRLKTMLRGLDRDEPHDQKMIADIERRLATIHAER